MSGIFQHDLNHYEINPKEALSIPECPGFRQKDPKTDGDSFLETPSLS